MDDQQQMWTLVIAVGGLVIAVVALGWNVYLHAVSKAKVKVTATIMRMYPTPPGLSEGEEVLLLEAVNMRSRPVTIKGFYGKLCKPGKDGKSNFWITGSCKELAAFASTFPCQIKEGDAVRLITLLGDETFSDVEYFFAGDTTGKNWHSRKHPLRRQIARRDREAT